MENSVDRWLDILKPKRLMAKMQDDTGAVISNNAFFDRTGLVRHVKFGLPSELKSAKYFLKAAKNKWDAFNASQATRKSEPENEFADKINRNTALVKLLEEESRFCNKLLKDRQAQEEKDAAKEKTKLDSELGDDRVGCVRVGNWLLNGKMKLVKGGGQRLREMDKREVRQNKKDEDYFVDNNMLVSEYKEKVIVKRLAYNAKKEQEGKEEMRKTYLGE